MHIEICEKHVGFKSIFAYSSQFTVVSTFEKVKRTWLFSKDTSKIDIIKLSEENIDEENQTLFIVPIKNDASNWYNNVIKTIPYFKGIIFDCQIETNKHYSFNWNKSYEFNETKIIEGKTFYYRKGAYDKFHVCLDQVIYNLNQSDFGIYLNYFPFGLKFSVNDGIMPLPNREQLQMTENTKSLILNKLKECLEELHEYYVEASLTLPEYFKNSDKLEFNIAGNNIELNEYDINQLCEKLGVKKFIKFNQVFTDISNLYNKEPFFKGCLLRQGIVKETRINPDAWYNYNNLEKTIIVQDLTTAQKKFLKKNYINYYLVKVKKQKFWGNVGFYQSLQLKDVPKEKWRVIVEEWIKEQKNWVSKCLEFPETEYQDWLKQQKKNKPSRKKLKEEEIKFQQIEKRERGVGLKKTSVVWQTNEFNKDKVYIHFNELDLKASQFYELYPWKIVPIIIDEKNLNKLKKFIKVLSPEQFEQTKYFKRLVYKKWLYANVNGIKYVMRNAFIEYNGILKDHHTQIRALGLKGQARLPDFLEKYELDSKYKPIQKYLECVKEKAEKNTIPNAEYHYRHNVAKQLFICRIKCNRLEKELNKLKHKQK